MPSLPHPGEFNGEAVGTLALLSLVLAGIVLALFWLRRRLGLTPLYVTLGVFQPVQVLLSSSIYMRLWPGMVVSPGTLMFAASLLAILVVYIREDALEARKIVYGVLGANLAMSLLLLAMGLEMGAPWVVNLLGVPAALFNQGSRVTIVGTVVLVADVLLLIVGYSALRSRFPRHPLLRAWATLTGVLVFDAIAFTAGAFLERPDFAALLAAGVSSKLLLGSFFSVLLIGYLRFVERLDAPPPRPAPLRDVFYAFTWRDRFELQAQQYSEERRQVFERITDAFVALDKDGVYTYVNARAGQLLGRRPEDLIGRHIWTVFPEGVGQPFDLAYRRAMAEQQPATLEAYYPPFDRWFENRIYPSPEGLTIYFHDITDRMLRQQDLVQRASQDELTGLPSRRVLRDELDVLLQQRPRTLPVAVLALNIDRLHHVNDTLGYAAGDQVLVEVAERLRQWAAAAHCQVGCLGGDQFLVIKELAHGGASIAASIEVLARQAIHVLAQPCAIDDQLVYLTCSAGASWFPEAGQRAAQLLEQADLALNVAKQRGRNQLALFSPNRSMEVARRLALTSRMRHALDADSFQLHYQPLVDASTGALVAAEALMRWQDDTLGPVGPDTFIPIAEDTGLIVRLGGHALRTAITTLADWLARGLHPVPVSVNVSAEQIQREEFVAELRDALAASGVPARLLKLEITESVLLQDLGLAIAVLDQLRHTGVRISLDDFGTGYSSLAKLRQLPIDEIKIDRVFVHGICEDTFAATLCRAIIDTSRQLKVGVVAEGVETSAEAMLLERAGCQLFQGYLFSRPLPAPIFEDYLVHRPSWTLAGERRPA